MELGEEGSCATGHTQRSEDNIVESILSSHCESNQSNSNFQVCMARAFYPPSHLAGP